MASFSTGKYIGKLPEYNFSASNFGQTRRAKNVLKPAVEVPASIVSQRRCFSMHLEGNTGSAIPRHVATTEQVMSDGHR